MVVVEVVASSGCSPVKLAKSEAGSRASPRVTEPSALHVTVTVCAVNECHTTAVISVWLREVSQIEARGPRTYLKTHRGHLGYGVWNREC